jgi:hypothetical protein
VKLATCETTKAMNPKITTKLENRAINVLSVLEIFLLSIHSATGLSKTEIKPAKKRGIKILLPVIRMKRMRIINVIIAKALM